MYYFVLTMSIQIFILNLESTNCMLINIKERRSAMATTFLQVRVDEKDKEKAAEILEQLGTNLSAVVNMMIKQIILTKSIPFEIRLKTDTTPLPLRVEQVAFEDAFNSFSVSEDGSDPVLDGIREEYES